MTLTVRPARLNDVPAIVAIERDAARAAHWSAQMYEELMESGVVLLAEDAAKVCGFICARAVVADWEIENVVVARESLRLGIADKLMSALLRRAKDEAASAILLEVRESNLAARGLYEKHGFREVGRRGMYYDSPAEDAILFTRLLDR